MFFFVSNGDIFGEYGGGLFAINSLFLEVCWLSGYVVDCLLLAMVDRFETIETCSIKIIGTSGDVALADPDSKLGNCCAH